MGRIFLKFKYKFFKFNNLYINILVTNKHIIINNKNLQKLPK